MNCNQGATSVLHKETYIFDEILPGINNDNFKFF